MNSIRMTIYLIKEQYKEAIIKPRVYMAFLLGIIITLQICLSYINYAGNNSVQVLEGFIAVFSNKFPISMILVAYYLLVCDAPFVSERTLMLIYRCNRMVWVYSMMIYIILQSILFYCTIFVTSVLAIMGKAYVGNGWSIPMYMLAKYSPASAEERFWLFSPGEALLKWQPYNAVIHIFILVCLYSILMGLIMFIFNMNVRRFLGNIIVIAIHFLNFTILYGGFINPKMSLLAHIILGMHGLQKYPGLSLISSYCLFLLSIILITMIAKKMIIYTDFKTSIGTHT